MFLVFCGTPRFAVPTLERLVEGGHSVPLVVTQPDRPRGRGMEVAVSPVKDAATRLGIVVLQPGTIKNNAEFRSQLAAIAPDAILVVGYGRIIPQWMIDLPRLGNLNLHASLLPKYRSATHLFNRLRGFQPWPGAFTTFKGKTLQVHRARPWHHAVTFTAGEVAV